MRSPSWTKPIWGNIETWPKLAAAQTGRIAGYVDFSGVDFMTSTGLGVLVAFAKRVEGVDGKIALCALNDDIREIFDTVGFTAFFDIHQSADEALASLA